MPSTGSRDGQFAAVFKDWGDVIPAWLHRKYPSGASRLYNRVKAVQRAGSGFAGFVRGSQYPNGGIYRTLYFHGELLFSYGEHWPLGWRVSDTHVLVPDRDYQQPGARRPSMHTRSQLWELRRTAEAAGFRVLPVRELPRNDPTTVNLARIHNANIEAITDALLKTHSQITRCRHPKYLPGWEESLRVSAGQLQEYFTLFRKWWAPGAGFSVAYYEETFRMNFESETVDADALVEDAFRARGNHLEDTAVIRRVRRLLRARDRRETLRARQRAERVRQLRELGLRAHAPHPPAKSQRFVPEAPPRRSARAVTDTFYV